MNPNRFRTATVPTADEPLTRRQAALALATMVATPLALATPAALLGERYHHQRARTLTGIPCYDYQWQTRSRSVQATARGLLLEHKIRELTDRILNNQAFLAQLRLRTPIVQDVRTAVRPGSQIASPTTPASATPAPTPANPGALPTPAESIEGRNGILRRGLRGLSGLTRRGQTPVVPSRVDTSPEVLPTPEDGLANAAAVEGLFRNSMRQLADVASLPANTRIFQLDRAQLNIDHCFISDVAVQVHRSGCWVLSLRADQNPRAVDDEADPFIYRPRLHLKRNEFNLRLRCYGLGSTPAAPRTLQAGRPMLADLHPVIFWVQRTEPRHVRVGCCDPRITRYFDDIRQMEVEFFYR